MTEHALGGITNEAASRKASSDLGVASTSGQPSILTEEEDVSPGEHNTIANLMTDRDPSSFDEV